MICSSGESSPDKVLQKPEDDVTVTVFPVVQGLVRLQDGQIADQAVIVPRFRCIGAPFGRLRGSCRGRVLFFFQGRGFFRFFLRHSDFLLIGN